jgi:hypothetical protein
MEEIPLTVEEVIQTLTIKYGASSDTTKIFVELAELIGVEYCIPPKRIKTQPEIILTNDNTWINIYSAYSKYYNEQTFAFEVYTIHPPTYQGGARKKNGKPLEECIGSIMCQFNKY